MTVYNIIIKTSYYGSYETLYITYDDPMDWYWFCKSEKKAEPFLSLVDVFKVVTKLSARQATLIATGKLLIIKKDHLDKSPCPLITGVKLNELFTKK